MQQAWPVELVWTEDEAYRAYSSRARFGFEDTAFDSSISSTASETEEEQLLQHGQESSAWVPVFEDLTRSRQGGSVGRRSDRLCVP